MSAYEIDVYGINEVYFKLDCEYSLKLELKGYLSCYAPNYKYHPKFKMRVWDGKISFFDVQNSTLPIGLFGKLREFGKLHNYKINIKFDTSKFKNNFKDEDFTSFFNKLFEGSKYFPRDYQQENVKLAINIKRGIILNPTSSGKSLSIYSIIRFLRLMKKRILLIVPNISLVDQMFNDFVDYGWDDIDKSVDVLYGGQKPNLKLPILISTWQSLIKLNPEILETYDAVLCDEVHLAKAHSISTLLKHCINAEYRIGLTGTLTDEPSDKFNIFGYLGPVLTELKTKDLQDRNLISDIKIVNLLVKYPDAVINATKNFTYPEEVKFITEYEDRNRSLDYIFSLIPDKENSLILCERIDHIKNIAKYIENNFNDKYTLMIVYGEIDPKEREEIFKQMELNDNLILLATYGTLSTGISIKKLHNVIFYSSYKSKVKVLQSIGRGLRKHESKSKMILWDVIDDMCYTSRNGVVRKNYVYRHWEGVETDSGGSDGRLKEYEKQGFKYFNKRFYL